MTTTALTAAPTAAARPVSWRRLLWVAWVRYRPAVVATTALTALTAAYLLMQGQTMRAAYAAATACTPASSPACRYAVMSFRNTYGDVGLAGTMFVWLPALIGAFAGAPLLARELETGTFRFAWTQGVGRVRWLIALLVPGALGVAAVSAALGRLVTWSKQPLVDAGMLSRLHGSVFPSSGVAVIGWGLVAYALGALIGLLVRRVVPALVLTFATWTGLALLAAGRRGHYLTPLVTGSQQVPGSDLSIEQWWSHGGVRVDQTQINHVLQAIGVQDVNGGGGFQVGPGSSSVDPVQYLTQHGYTQWTSYQPGNRYWTFQVIEFGWLTALSLLLLTATLLLVRRRPA
jgi:hypothetical protein